MKKLFIITAIVTILLTYTICSHADGYDTIKVGLSYGDSAKASVSIKTASGLSYGVYDGGHTETGILTGSDFTVSAYSESEVLINGVQVVYTAGSNLSLVPLEGSIFIDSKEYRGSVIITNASASAINIINVLPMEEYLYGVIGGEMPFSWHTEALKAQAVCARGFAVSNFNKHASLGFNVCATTNCQVYSGVSGETPSVTEAVDATAGQIVTYEGKTAETLFYSASGGHSANVKNVWGSSIPYLSGVEDPYESEDAPRHSWSATLTLDEISQILLDRGDNIGTVTSLTAKTDETGRTYELTAEGTDGSVTLTRQNTYSPFYSKGVLSQKYTIVPVGESTREVYAISKSPISALSSKYAINSRGVIADISSGFAIISASGTDYYTTGEVTAYTFQGGGWGHGVGMSQYGAKGMAENGFTYDAILSHYYPGTELSDI